MGLIIPVYLRYRSIEVRTIVRIRWYRVNNVPAIFCRNFYGEKVVSDKVMQVQEEALAAIEQATTLEQLQQVKIQY